MQTVLFLIFFWWGANLYGYIKCKYGANKKLSTVATGFLGRQLWSSVSVSII
jgi:hypothetical protein